MSRDILFKAKRTDTGEWVEGYYYKQQIVKNSPAKKHFIIVTEFPKRGELAKAVFYEVDPSTLCQCTGYEGIWENDIFQCEDERYQIEFDDESLVWNAVAVYGSESVELGEFYSDEIDIIGNIFDNPELLKGEANE